MVMQELEVEYVFAMGVLFKFYTKNSQYNKSIFNLMYLLELISQQWHEND